MTGSTVSWLRRGASLGALASAAALVLALLALLAGMALGYRLLVVRSGSMEPALMPGDVIVTRVAGPETVNPGDVVTFRDASRGDRLITHRVVQSVSRDGYVEFETRGDANTGSEHWWVHRGGTVGTLSLRLTGTAAASALALDARVRVGVLLLSAAATTVFALRAVWTR